MSKSDWEISGTGGLSIVNDDGSKRWRLAGKKQMLWNEESVGTDYEVVADIQMANSFYAQGGLLLRSNLSGESGYRLLIHGNGLYYYIQKMESGNATTLGQLERTRDPNAYIKTRFRIDGWQLSVEEYINSEWVLLMVVDDTSESFACGYFGLYGNSIDSRFNITFDNVEINKKEWG